MARASRKIITLLLRELMSAGAISAAAKTLLDSGPGNSIRDKALATLHEAVRDNLWRIVAAVVAAVLLVTAAGFFVAGFFLWLLSFWGAPLAAAAVGAVLLVAGGTLLWLSYRDKKTAPVAEPATPPESDMQKLFATASSLFEGLKTELGKYSTPLFALLFLGGLWFGFQDDGDENDKNDNEGAGA